MSRGRGRGKFSSEFIESDDEDGKREGGAVGGKRSSEDSSEEDDFIASFRKMHASSGAPVVTPSSSIDGDHRPRVGRGRGRPMGRGRTGASPVVEPDVAEPGFSTTPSLSSPSTSSIRSSHSSSPIVGRSSSSSDHSDRAVVVKKGSSGTAVALSVNYIRLKLTKNMGMFEYHVDFDPEIGSTRLKRMVIQRNAEMFIGSVVNFDGAKLYLPIELPDKITEFNVSHPTTHGEVIHVKVKYIKQNYLEECTHFYNVLLRRVMERLGYVEIQRNFFDYLNVFEVPEHKLDIWPGFVTAIEIQEDGLMLCCDSTFRVLRTSTMLDTLYQMINVEDNFRGNYNFREKFNEFAVGQIVITRYNNRNYKIDDVDWTKSPRSTFSQKTKNGQNTEISFIEYFKRNYSQNIRDLEQPMLVARGKMTRQVGFNNFAEEPKLTLLVPELCFISGMTADITKNQRTMRAIAERTRIPPIKRCKALEKYIADVNSKPDVRQIFEDWGIKLMDGIVELNGRVISTPTILFGGGRTAQPNNGDFSRDLMRSNVLNPISVMNWILFCTGMDMEKASRAIRSYSIVAPSLGIEYLGEPEIVRVPKDTVSCFQQALQEKIRHGVTQFVMVIIPSNRDDLYRVVKSVCTQQIPVASQVIRGVTLTDEKKIRSVMQKVTLQINCKLGGSLWTIRIPVKGLMFVGMDVYHDPRRKRASVTAVVASINGTYTKYYSRVILQQAQQETVSSLRPVMVEALRTYCEENKAFPTHVIMFRDGVGDGQIELTRQHEVAQISSSFEDLGISPKLTFCIVQKRINTRLFLKTGGYIENPGPGTVLDHTITRRYHFDFFLVSQLIREGTVNPTHYIVISDNSDMTPDHMQKFAYATSYMYYNWSGSIRVPAMCQYAHKAAGLVGQHLGSEPSRVMADKLYYL